MIWWPAPSVLGDLCMTLESRDTRLPWQRLVVILAKREIRIEDGSGEILATASSLPALLDAVDGGINESIDLPAAPAQAAAYQDRPAAYQDWRSSLPSAVSDWGRLRTHA